MATAKGKAKLPQVGENSYTTQCDYCFRMVTTAEKNDGALTMCPKCQSYCSYCISMKWFHKQVEPVFKFDSHTRWVTWQNRIRQEKLAMACTCGKHLTKEEIERDWSSVMNADRFNKEVPEAILPYVDGES